MKTIEEFCHIHDACSGGRTWATANCSTMQEAWDKAPYPLWVLWIATRQGVLTDRELRLFAVWCARRVQHLLTDPRSINAIDVAERYANGEATDEELKAARVAALAATGAAASAEERAACGVAAYAADEAADWAADGAAYAANTAEAIHARAACSTFTAQAQWLRENTKPNFA